MMLRLYRAVAKDETIAEYERFETAEGVPMVRSMPGCLAVGFGRVVEEKEPTYVFFSVWENRTAMDAARSTPTWKQVADKLQKLGFTRGEDRAEHVDLRAFGSTATSPASRH